MPHLSGNEFLNTTAKDLNIHLQVPIRLLHAVVLTVVFSQPSSTTSFWKTLIRTTFIHLQLIGSVAP